ncbi:MAG: hypothetical protein ACR2GY_01850 [Phycisphaerales bacterium]
MSLLSLMLCAPAALAITLGGCQSQNKTNATQPVSMGVINANCPIMDGHPVSAEAKTTMHKGERIGFCCDGCIGAWNKMSDAEKDAYVAAQSVNFGTINSSNRDASAGCCGTSK